MALGDPLFIGAQIQRGEVPVPQEGARFTENEYDLDDGERCYLVHPDTKRSLWPKIGDKDAVHPAMFVVAVEETRLDSTLIELRASYRGVVGTGGKKKALKIIPGCDTQIVTLPATGQSDIVAPIPVPTLTLIAVTTIKPTYTGVGSPAANPAGGGFLPEPPGFSVSFLPDPDARQTLNYYGNTWVFMSRTWEDYGGRVYVVRDFYQYFYSLAV